jgi:hypothetical protein
MEFFFLFHFIGVAKIERRKMLRKLFMLLSFKHHWSFAKNNSSAVKIFNGKNKIIL